MVASLVQGYSMRKLMLCVVALAAMVGPVRAQQTENPPAAANSPAQVAARTGLEILSDTMGVDFLGTFDNCARTSNAIGRH